MKQYTLESLISELSELPEETKLFIEIEGEKRKASDLISWRGDYRELSIDSNSDEKSEAITAKRLLQQAERILSGDSLEGYKGGDFTMFSFTPIWADEYGNLGEYMPVLLEKTSNGEAIFRTVQIA
jgi:hypothetical protein